jgi:hypothetical protein
VPVANEKEKAKTCGEGVGMGNAAGEVIKRAVCGCVRAPGNEMALRPRKSCLIVASNPQEISAGQPCRCHGREIKRGHVNGV